MNIILLGAPGAGKGTQAKILQTNHDMVQLSTGDMLRAARTSGTDMGKRVAAIMDAGELVTDEIVIGLIEETIKNERANGFIFDGFPRTLPQADALDQLLTRTGEKLDRVIELRVDDSALISRIVARSTCVNCGEGYNDLSKPIPSDGKCTKCGSSEGFSRRADDNEESLRTRLMEYYKKTSPLIGYYYSKGLLEEVDGLENVSAAIREIIFQ